ncbi:hypothetical protein KV205_09760 [Streptomyces sp. SKN60]|uniref:hypothetical protein n=1 Tax=Streptomyces sp. SKN60 TaxID=2855506 RepID=UPI002247DB90|nr:hypothetical protein [Streptomyces sp. SKN60]MCX2180812.1 hypothetical protein [Streptomyces sp. SKN60]
MPAPGASATPQASGVTVMGAASMAAADGHHPGTNYRINGGSWHNVQYNLGNGYCADLNLSIGESGYIDIQACNYEGSTALNCSAVRRVSANG